MATQTTTAKTVDQYLENEGWVKAAHNVDQLREKARGFFDRMGEILWRVSFEVQPLRHLP